MSGVSVNVGSRSSGVVGFFFGDANVVCAKFDLLVHLGTANATGR
jgi:hypothetical protein